tara:strand:+ start:435 stop:1424 length:990 start_codon:yes stop_codon:yes gene_type:complete
MSKILIIDPGKGWGHFVSKMYCYRKLSETLNKKITFLTKKSTQAEHYLKFASFCENVLYLDEPKKGFINIFNNINSLLNNIKQINKIEFTTCFIFHPSIRYLLMAKFSKAKDIWGLGLKLQNFMLPKNKKLYNNFFSKTIPSDRETLEFIKKITNVSNIKFKPLCSNEFDKKKLVGIIIAASGHEKRWGIRNYIKIIKILINYKFKNFLIISGLDQGDEENLIKKETFEENINMIFTSNKNISEVLINLKKCIFCIGNDTGFSHLSVNLDVKTLIIYGDCPPQNYSNLIHHIDIDDGIKRSSNSIHSISTEKVNIKLLDFLKKERWPSG